MRKVCFHWITHDLTEVHKVQKVIKSKELLDQLQALQLMSYRFSCDINLMDVGGKRLENRARSISDEKEIYFLIFI